MTAVAPPPNFANIPRSGWNAPNGNTANGLTSMSADDLRMFMPPARKTAQRSNSSSSLSSQSSSSTLSSSSQPNGAGPAGAGEGSAWAVRKKQPRGLWPASKAEPVSGISTTRTQSITSAGPGSSAPSALSALQHTPSPMVPSQHNGSTQTQVNGAPRQQGRENPAILHLIPMNGTFDRKTINVPFYPDVVRIGRQTNNKTIPTPQNGYFDSKVLSRQHAEIWADPNGKVWIRDVKSSNGTFVNGKRLSPENRDSDPHELREQDMLELGIDIVSEDQKTIVHHKVAARVEHAGIYPNLGGNMLDLTFGDLDSQQYGNMNGPQGQPGMSNMRGRTPSQGQMVAGRLQGPAGMVGGQVNGMNHPRHQNFWLQPITMEQVVKKLNSELKAARQQSQELQQTSQYINTILSTDVKKEPSSKSSSHGARVSPIKDLKARFSEPPAPPPQQPLPEKPDANQLSLRRSEIERPKSTSALGRSDSQAQISTLTEALTSAKKEIESQSGRLRDLEELLVQERRARESAEERADRLEKEAVKETVPSQMNGTIGHVEDISEPKSEKPSTSEADAKPLNAADLATARLQQRLEMMMTEMSEMKQQMERYRLRAEAAEQESATHRKSLAEMVEKIRQDEAERQSAEVARRHRSVEEESPHEVADSADGAEEDTEEGEIMIINGKDMNGDGAGALFKRIGVQNGHVVGPHETADSKLPQALATRPNHNEITLMHGAPAASILGIVLIGVGLMAWLNNYQKVER